MHGSIESHPSEDGSALPASVITPYCVSVTLHFSVRDGNRGLSPSIFCAVTIKDSPYLRSFSRASESVAAD
jgi:hypothetical protein